MNPSRREFLKIAITGGVSAGLASQIPLGGASTWQRGSQFFAAMSGMSRVRETVFENAGADVFEAQYYLDLLARYNNGDYASIPRNYPSVKDVISTIKDRPGYTYGFNHYGADMLARVAEDVPKALDYPLYTRAIVRQGQTIFYMVVPPNTTPAPTGKLVDGEFSRDERDFVRDYMNFQIETHESGNGVIPLDDSIGQIWSDPLVVETNLRQLFPYELFTQYMDTGEFIAPKVVPWLINHTETDRMFELAKNNFSRYESFRTKSINNIRDAGLFQRYVKRTIDFRSEISDIRARLREVGTEFDVKSLAILGEGIEYFVAFAGIPYAGFDIDVRVGYLTPRTSAINAASYNFQALTASRIDQDIGVPISDYAKQAIAPQLISDRTNAVSAFQTDSLINSPLDFKKVWVLEPSDKSPQQWRLIWSR